MLPAAQLGNSRQNLSMSAHRQHATCPAAQLSCSSRGPAPQLTSRPRPPHSRQRRRLRGQQPLHCQAAPVDTAPDTATEAAPDMTAPTPADSNAATDIAAAAMRRLAERRSRMQAAIPAGPRNDPPSYEAIDAAPHNWLFMHLFRQAVVDGLGEDAPESG